LTATRELIEHIIGHTESLQRVVTAVSIIAVVEVLLAAFYIYLLFKNKYFRSDGMAMNRLQTPTRKVARLLFYVFNVVIIPIMAVASSLLLVPFLCLMVHEFLHAFGIDSINTLPIYSMQMIRAAIVIIALVISGACISVVLLWKRGPPKGTCSKLLYIPYIASDQQDVLVAPPMSDADLAVNDLV
jgi:hypothetical protein